MKLIITIVSNDDSSTVQKALINERFFVTKLSSTGGFLKSGNTTFMIGAKDQDVDKIVKIIETHSKTRKEIIPSAVVREFGITESQSTEVVVGGATLFIMDVEKFIKL